MVNEISCMDANVNEFVKIHSIKTMFQLELIKEFIIVQNGKPQV